MRDQPVVQQRLIRGVAAGALCVRATPAPCGACGQVQDAARTAQYDCRGIQENRYALAVKPAAADHDYWATLALRKRNQFLVRVKRELLKLQYHRCVL